MDPPSFAGARKTTFSPLLTSIGVEPASLAYKLANTATEAVTLLTHVGFSGFEIGFRESVLTRSVAGPEMLSFDPFNTPSPSLASPSLPL
jgi:hypothetical protein